jgi:segregation and condensation protein B
MNPQTDDRIIEQLAADEPRVESRETVVVDKGAFPPTTDLQSPTPDPGQPATDLPPPSTVQVIEALLFAAPAPVPLTRLCAIAGCTPEALNDAIEQLNREYDSARRAFRIHRVAQGFQLYTLPEFASWARQLFTAHRVSRLSRASLETLAIIAYRQPVTKPEIEQLRGVDATAPILTLLERRLIVLAGRAHKPGNPFLYRTSKEFLRYFGLADLDLLPSRDELEEFLRTRAEQAEKEDDELLSNVAGQNAEVRCQDSPDGAPDSPPPDHSPSLAPPPEP